MIARKNTKISMSRLLNFIKIFLFKSRLVRKMSKHKMTIIPILKRSSEKFGNGRETNNNKTCLGS